MVIKDSTIYAVGAVNISGEKDKDGKDIFKYDAGVVLFNTSGKYLGKYSIGEDTHHRFNSVILDNDNLILTGVLDVSNKNKEKYESFTVEFNIKENKFSSKKILTDKNDYLVNEIVNLDKKILVGTSKSNYSLYGADYVPIITEYK